MSYEINMTTQAQNDLRDIFEYIAFTLQSPQNAAGQLDRLEGSIDSLAQMPERFRVYDKEPWRSRNLRIMPVDHLLKRYEYPPEGMADAVQTVMSQCEMWADNVIAVS